MRRCSGNNKNNNTRTLRDGERKRLIDGLQACVRRRRRRQRVLLDKDWSKNPSDVFSSVFQAASLLETCFLFSSCFSFLSSSGHFDCLRRRRAVFKNAMVDHPVLLVDSLALPVVFLRTMAVSLSAGWSSFILESGKQTTPNGWGGGKKVKYSR